VESKGAIVEVAVEVAVGVAVGVAVAVAVEVSQAADSELRSQGVVGSNLPVTY
jgi:hypothetical protein